MSTAAETATQDTPQRLWSLLEDAVDKLNGGPSEREPAAKSPLDRSTRQNISAYIPQIDSAARLIVASAKRLRELEEEVRKRDLELARVHALEQVLASERLRAGRAEALATSAQARAKELESDISTAMDRVESLAAVMSSAFPEGLQSKLLLDEGVPAPTDMNVAEEGIGEIPALSAANAAESAPADVPALVPTQVADPTPDQLFWWSTRGWSAHA